LFHLIFVGDEFHHSGTREFFSGGILFEPVRLPEKIMGLLNCYQKFIKICKNI